MVCSLFSLNNGEKTDKCAFSQITLIHFYLLSETLKLPDATLCNREFEFVALGLS